jgi:uncharacterized protein
LTRDAQTQAKLSHEEGEQTYAVIFDKGDEVMQGLTSCAQQHGLTAAQITAISAFSDARLGYFDWEGKDYTPIPINEQVEVLSLVGDIALNKGEPYVHVHVVVGKADGIAHGGHLLEGHVWPTLEVVVVEPPTYLRRTMDSATGLALIDLEAV